MVCTYTIIIFSTFSCYILLTKADLRCIYIHCVPIMRKLRNATGRISGYSALSLAAPDSCSESVTVDIKKVDVGVMFLRAQFSSLFFLITSNVHY
jgi:hypothetical protein